MTDKPQIDLGGPLTTFCPRHLEPFRAGWPNGYATALICLFHQSVQRDEIIAAAGADVSRLSAVLREFGPLCCLVGDDVTAEITAGALADDPDEWRAMLDKYGPPRVEREAEG